MVNRTQLLVLGFFALAWVSIVSILIAAPEVYDQALRLPRGDRTAEVIVLSSISSLIALLSFGVVRRWRWSFWLILVAFFAGVIRVPVSLLQLAEILRAGVPAWYVGFQSLLGVVQFGIAFAMWAGYRGTGTWGAF